jgi:hypothetical protein
MQPQKKLAGLFIKNFGAHEGGVSAEVKPPDRFHPHEYCTQALGAFSRRYTKMMIPKSP